MRNLLNEWIGSCHNNSSPPNKERFFRWGQKKLNCLVSPSQRFFYVNSKQFKRNSHWSEKYLENTKVSKKEIQPEDLMIRKTATWKCSSKKLFRKIRETFLENIRLVYSFNFTNKNTPPQMFSWEFSQIFQNSYIKEHLTTAASEIIHKSSRDSFLFYRSGHSQEL